MEKTQEFQRMPTRWILDKDNFLQRMNWSGPSKSDQTAALMVYVALLHLVVSDPDDPDNGVCKAPYGKLHDMTSLSRSKISAGIKILELNHRIVKKTLRGSTNVYSIPDYDTGYWGKLPIRGLYKKGTNEIASFYSLKLRSKIELHALKLYFLLIALRDRKKGYTVVGYEKISKRIGLAKNDIKSAISLLINLNLIQLDRGHHKDEEHKHNIYWIRHVNVYRHAGNEPNN